MLYMYRGSNVSRALLHKGPAVCLLTTQSALFVSKENFLWDVTHSNINVNFQILHGKQ